MPWNSNDVLCNKYTRILRALGVGETEKGICTMHLDVVIFDLLLYLLPHLTSLLHAVYPSWQTTPSIVQYGI
jgi:uncharacterized membrane protein YqaE (UPF0057 family)